MMARFQLLTADEALVGSMRRRLRAGTIVVDSAADPNYSPSTDLICPTLATAPTIKMVPLNASAVAAMAAVGISATIGQNLYGVPSGADSVDA
jgi:hypothetical protein